MRCWSERVANFEVKQFRHEESPGYLALRPNLSFGAHFLNWHLRKISAGKVRDHHISTVVDHGRVPVCGLWNSSLRSIDNIGGTYNASSFLK